jgi:hypothetical protein
VGSWGERLAGEVELLNSWHEKLTYYGNGQFIGQFTLLIIRLGRKDSKTVVFSVTLNGVTQTLIDDDPKEQVKKTNSMAIDYPNVRPFRRIVPARKGP